MKSLSCSLKLKTLCVLLPLAFVLPSPVQAQQDAPLPGLASDEQGNVVIEQISPVVETQDAPQPPQAGLAAPSENVSEAMDPAQQALSTLEQDSQDENLFYDAESLAPTGEFVRKGGTVKVNPRTQPASKFVVVRSNHSANSTKAKLVAASRAMTLGRHDSALQIYDTIYKRNKRDPQVLMGRAISLQHLGRIDEAILAYNEFLDRRPDDVNAHINMLGLLAQKYPAVALRRLLDLNEKHESNVGVMAQIAITYAKMQQYENAFKYLGAAAAMEPNNPGHLYNIAIVADKAGDPKSAIEYYEQALEVDALHGSGGVPRESIYERLAQLR